MSDDSIPFEALREVRSHFDTEEAMAAAFGVSQPTVWRWLNQAKQLPPEKVLLAETLTGVSCWRLRPDIYPPEKFQSSGDRPVEEPAADSLAAAGARDGGRP